MLSNEIEQTLHTITGSKNPEIYHYQRGSHPGVKWYIKTIIPGYGMLTDDSYPLWAMWRFLTEHYPHLIKIINSAYDWQGNLLTGWWTIWLDQRIDIRVKWSKEDGFDWKLVDYEDGLKLSAEDISSMISTLFDDRHTEQETLQFKQLNYILDFLRTYTTDKRSKENRKKLKVIENDQISDEAADTN